MPIIQRLEDSLANMIAAGEVIERPASVVKELVENAIDAHATSIEVHLLEAGIKKIEVIDDGDGMDQEDAKMAFFRHATSKIHNQHDLYRIQTLGFRGEAIPSIASVSLMTLKTNQNGNGYYVTYQAGKLINQGAVALNKGTNIIVENLFFNTPARLKYLKSPNIELGAVTEYMDRLALSHPNIRFTLTNDKKTLLKTNGYNNMLSLFGEIYGLEVAKNVIPFKSETPGLTLRGYLVSPSVNRARKNFISLIVNDRIVRNASIINAVVDGYATYIPLGRYPIAVLFIDIDPLTIDVNVHPTKMEIKFAENNDVCKIVLSEVKKALQAQNDLITEINMPVEQKIQEQNFQTVSLFERPEIEKSPEKVLTNTNVEYMKTDRQLSVSTADEYATSNEVFEDNEKYENNKLPYMQYIGQFSGTYLLFQGEEGLFIVDQHAAAERIRYEQYYERLGDVNNASQPLLFPISLELTRKECMYIEENIGIFTSLGFTIEESGVNSYYIRSVPLWLKDDIEETAEKMINLLIEKNVVDISKIRDSLAKSIACKGAIKANKSLNIEEIDYLINNLAKCMNPYTCPHGRPTIIKFTNYEIEKMFKRVM